MSTNRCRLILNQQSLGATCVFLCWLFACSAVAGPGGVDLTFDPASGVNGAVYSIVVQSDGKVIIGGEFSTVRGAARSGIARLNADGTVDRTFNPGSGVTRDTVSFTTNTFIGDVYSLALQPDGKLLIGGRFDTVNGISRNYLARLDSAGGLDPSFAPEIVGNDQIDSIALQSDGRVLIGGSFTNLNGVMRTGIARLHSDGTLDDSFKPQLEVERFSVQVRVIKLQDDGKVLIGGYFGSINGNDRNSIARLNEDGSLDLGFNPGSGPGGRPSRIKSAVIQSDHKILVAGNFSAFDGTNRNCIARLHADGSLDTSFDPGGGLHGSILQLPGIASLALQSDGRVLIGGEFTSVNGTNRNCIARLNPDGSLDESFDPGAGVSSSVYSLALQPDGKIFAGGSFQVLDWTNRNAIVRFNPNGSLDTSLDPGTKSALPEDVSCVALQPDGKVLLGVANSQVDYYKWPYPNTIVRLNDDGNLDSTFNIGAGLNNEVNSVAVQNDGKILVGGNFSSVNGTNRTGLARLNSNGSLDLTLNAGMAANSVVNSIIVQPDDNILICGTLYQLNGTNRNLARLNSDGSHDVSFFPGAITGISQLALQPDGKLLVGGSFTSINGTTRNRIARLNSDGSLDFSFDPGSGPNSAVSSIALQPDGKILIGGGFTSVGAAGRRYIARLNADGTLDNSFNPGPWASIGFFSSHVDCIAFQWNGKILVGGNFNVTNGMSANHLACFHSDGALDRGFVPSGFRPGEWSGGGYVYSIAVQSDGRIVIGGNFGTVGDLIRERVARLWGDGPALVYGPEQENGDFVARFRGVPGLDYTLEISEALSPGNWQKSSNKTAASNDEALESGIFELREPILSSSNRFFRAVYPAY